MSVAKTPKKPGYFEMAKAIRKSNLLELKALMRPLVFELIVPPR